MLAAQVPCDFFGRRRNKITKFLYQTTRVHADCKCPYLCGRRTARHCRQILSKVFTTHTLSSPLLCYKNFWTLSQVAFCHWSNRSSFEFPIRYWPNSWKMCRYEGFHKQAV
jgi:hypothetical protein